MLRLLLTTLVMMSIVLLGVGVVLMFSDLAWWFWL